jgi:hypothetical protein
MDNSDYYWVLENKNNLNESEYHYLVKPERTEYSINKSEYPAHDKWIREHSSCKWTDYIIYVCIISAALYLLQLII